MTAYTGLQTKFQFTPSSRRVTLDVREISAGLGISIHTLLAESDIYMARAKNLTEEISIHTLLAESDTSLGVYSVLIARFQFTPSSRRVTSVSPVYMPYRTISIHTLLAESDQEKIKKGCVTWISIHTLLAESDSTGNQLPV